MLLMTNLRDVDKLSGGELSIRQATYLVHDLNCVAVLTENVVTIPSSDEFNASPLCHGRPKAVILRSVSYQEGDGPHEIRDIAPRQVCLRSVQYQGGAR
jgi:hypothetical protein